MERVAILGMGHVGSLMSRLFSPVVATVEYDPKLGVPYPCREIAACDFAVVCVDTPSSATGECDVSNVYRAIELLPVDRVLLRSTVAPGTTDALVRRTGKTICYWPEYVGETRHSSSYWSDDRDMPFMVLGGAPEARRWFLDALLPLLGPATTYFQCAAIDAEIVKYMENAFLATKVTFVNEFFEICEHFGADWHSVREGWLLDPRIGRSHSGVFRDDRGFAGKCLPKDLRAIIAAARDAGYDPSLLGEVLVANERLRAAPPPVLEAVPAAAALDCAMRDA